MELPKIQAVVVPKRRCRCGGEFFVATLVGGGSRPQVFHTGPVCQQLGKLSGADFLKWVRTGEEPAAPPVPNRRARRQMARTARRGLYRV